MYLLDTNILSELVKKNPNRNLINRLEPVPSAFLYTASICVMELRYGALRMGNRLNISHLRCGPVGVRFIEPAMTGVINAAPTRT